MLLEHVRVSAELGCMFAGTVGQVTRVDLVFLWLILLKIESTYEVENRCSAIKRRASGPLYQRPAFT